ncbi:TPA: hypothetical protein ACKRTE_002223 [Providencia rettgeri]
MQFLRNILKGNYSIHYLAIGWYLSTTVVSFVFEKYPSTNPTLRMETSLYLIATSRALQSLISLLVLIGLFQILKNNFTKVGVLYALVATIYLSTNIAVFYDLIDYINTGDCETAYWCMRTYFNER